VRQYRLLIQVKTLMQRGVLAAEKIAAELHEKSFPVEKAQKLVGLYSFGELDAIMDRLLETDVAMKTGGDPDTLLDVLVADLTSPTRKRTPGSPSPAHAPVASVTHPLS
jgi:DNA polymerase III delta subunit